MCESCPCGSGNSYETCCGLLHCGSEFAATAEQLMGSRYSAFVKNIHSYLISTHHISKRKTDDEQVLKQAFGKTQWLGLRVLASSKGATTKDKATVEFVAFYEQHGKLLQLHELSEFVRENNRWFYLAGKILPPLKLKRNDSCVCGSGKKLKKCHGN